MIVSMQPLTYPPRSCRPQWNGHQNKYAQTLNYKPPKRNGGKRWKWPGSTPHATRMHHYASLTSDQKTAWTALAATMNNDHSTHGITTYNGPIAYMQTNLFLRMLGSSYTDDAPTLTTPADPRTATLDTAGGRFSAILVDLDP